MCLIYNTCFFLSDSVWQSLGPWTFFKWVSVNISQRQRAWSRLQETCARLAPWSRAQEGEWHVRAPLCLCPHPRVPWLPSGILHSQAPLKPEVLPCVWNKETSGQAGPGHQIQKAAMVPRGSETRKLCSNLRAGAVPGTDPPRLCSTAWGQRATAQQTAQSSELKRSILYSTARTEAQSKQCELGTLSHSQVLTLRGTRSILRA